MQTSKETAHTFYTKAQTIMEQTQTNNTHKGVKRQTQQIRTHKQTTNNKHTQQTSHTHTRSQQT